MVKFLARLELLIKYGKESNNVLMKKLSKSKLSKKLKKINLVVTDVDGVLTDGKLYYTQDGETQKVFHVRDGLGIKQLLSFLPVVIISGNPSTITERRAKDLGISHVYTSISNKLHVLQSIQNQLKISNEETLVIGDDLNDLILKESAGLFICPLDAHNEILIKSDFIIPIPGGCGAFRYISDLIIESRDSYKKAKEPWLSLN